MVHYSVDVCKGLEKEFAACQVDRSVKIQRYDPGDTMVYEVAPILTQAHAGRLQARLQVEKFVGGGFAGQVYKVKLLSIEGQAKEAGLEPGRIYALKILVPPSQRSAAFRNFLYGIGFQAPFQLQVNPVAARSGAIWQEFIRRAAAVRFGDEAAVNRIHATLVDRTLGSCGEISNWVEGRPWRLEVDEHIDLLGAWEHGKEVPEEELGSPEYRYKKTFMKQFVEMLHEIGAHELARQYEWSTWKSQPNVMKRLETDGEPEGGLTAIDFRAGLALLPFLPMSPGDVKLIIQGMRRGSLVQFDRCDTSRLEAYVQAHPQEFGDMLPLLDELKDCEREYRDSIPDITHNFKRLLTSRTLWGNIMQSTVRGWRLQNLADRPTAERLRSNKIFFLWFVLLGFLPFLGGVMRKYTGRPEYRSHYQKMLSDFGYFRRALSAKRIESLIGWYRSGRVTETTISSIKRSLPLYVYHMALSVLPPTLHHMLSDRKFLLWKLHEVLIRPFKIYFNLEERQRWLREMVADGREQGIISSKDEEEILSQVDDPYIHTYLKSLAVHVMLAPTTHIVSGGLALYYLITHPEVPRVQAYAVATGIIALFQVIPVSPGSLARGLYVLFLAIREKNFRDYSIALGMAFFKYIGYLAFPIQMAYRYPTMARFMAGYWATHMVHVVPVFGESGALLEHQVFRLFYNLPLTLRRKMWEREAIRRMQSPRFWHAVCIVVVFALLGAYIDGRIIVLTGAVPTIGQIAPALVASGFLGGFLVNLGSGGASSRKRVSLAVSSGLALGVLVTIFSFSMHPGGADALFPLLSRTVWASFITTTVSAIGAVAAEFNV